MEETKRPKSRCQRVVREKDLRLALCTKVRIPTLPVPDHLNSNMIAMAVDLKPYMRRTTDMDTHSMHAPSHARPMKGNTTKLILLTSKAALDTLICARSSTCLTNPHTRMRIMTECPGHAEKFARNSICMVRALFQLVAQLASPRTDLEKCLARVLRVNTIIQMRISRARVEIPTTEKEPWKRNTFLTKALSQLLKSLRGVWGGIGNR